MNKFYIQIVFFLLSISLYVNNKTLATEPAPEENTKTKEKTKTKSKDRCSTPEKIYEQNKDLLCDNPEETNQAIKLMGEAVIHFVYYATNKEGYKLRGRCYSRTAHLYTKKHENNTNVEKVHYPIYYSDKGNEIANNMWDPDVIKSLDYYSTKRKIVRVYNPNLIMIQQRYKDWIWKRQKYFYALVTKSQISEDKTIIAMTSPNVNDHNTSAKEYKNTIIENANLFTTDIDSEEDIRKGELEKTFVNIAGYLIEKKGNYSDITYVESVSDIQILIA
ncbi:fam-a protein [Plasmodium vinckei lentum]|uniref:Fam-a protein n=1 Tax=Plasmodium vinckei lentum TaxID=138297 RepID=A0A6V7SNF4_PLAVN|nr:fam-a protein [Plasmodium vinckei lentum]